MDDGRRRALSPALARASGAYVIHEAPRRTAGCGDAAADVLWRESVAAIGLSETEQDAVLRRED